MDEQLSRLLARQCGVVSRLQVLASGHTDRWLSHQVKARRWQRLGRDVYMCTTGQMAITQRHWAAVLRCGARAALAGEDAVGLWIPPPADGAAEQVEMRWDGPAQSALRPTTVAIDESRRIDDVPGIDLWRVQDLAHLVHPAREPPRLRLEPAVLMTSARAKSADDAIGLVADACGSLRTTPSRLADSLDRLPGNLRFRRLLGELLSDVSTGAYSYLEVRYLRDVERPHGLPSGGRQRLVRCGRRIYLRDVEYVGFDVVAELDGRLGHESYDGRAIDMDRDNVTVRGGSVTTRLGYRQLVRHACESATHVATLLRHRGWLGDLRRCGRDCRVD